MRYIKMDNVFPTLKYKTKLPTLDQILRYPEIKLYKPTKLTIQQGEEVAEWRKQTQHRLYTQVEELTKVAKYAKKHGVGVFFGKLEVTKITKDGVYIPYGLSSLKVVTTAGVGFIVDAFQNIVELEIMKYHAIGTSSAAEAVGDTGLTTELTTQYIVDNVRATGTTTEGASANIYQTVATNTVDSGVTIEEHGIMSDANVGSGVLLDRSLTGSVVLSASDSIQTTYSLTVSAGG
jgi:hypothetical protein